jgi:hypothetical protein
LLLHKYNGTSRLSLGKASVFDAADEFVRLGGLRWTDADMLATLAESEPQVESEVKDEQTE